jgi:hypothetical protein
MDFTTSSVLPMNIPLTSLAVPMIRGFSTTMYAMVKNVTNPPRISRLYVEPRAERLNQRSNPLTGFVETGVDTMPPTRTVDGGISHVVTERAEG